jgi:hypothetical protein
MSAIYLQLAPSVSTSIPYYSSSRKYVPRRNTKSGCLLRRPFNLHPCMSLAFQALAWYEFCCWADRHLAIGLTICEPKSIHYHYVPWGFGSGSSIHWVYNWCLRPKRNLTYPNPRAIASINPSIYQLSGTFRSEHIPCPPTKESLPLHGFGKYPGH